MKKLLLALLCITTIGAAFPAFAGPDWNLIEQGRKAKQTQMVQAANKAPQAGMDHQMDPKMDHQMSQNTDPKMQEKMDAMMKNCQEMMQKS